MAAATLAEIGGASPVNLNQPVKINTGRFREHVKVLKKLGEGAFGVVHWRKPSHDTDDVRGSQSNVSTRLGLHHGGDMMASDMDFAKW